MNQKCVPFEIVNELGWHDRIFVQGSNLKIFRVVKAEDNEEQFDANGRRKKLYKIDHNYLEKPVDLDICIYRSIENSGGP